MKSDALILLHGYPFEHTLWDQVIPRLGSAVRVFAPDLRGFNGTPVGDAEPGLEVMAADVVELLDRERIKTAVLAGFSMGGYVALALAEHYAHRLGGLALINSQPFADTDEARAGRRALIEKVREEGPAAAADAALPKMFAAANAGRPELIRAVREGAERAGVAGITWALEAMARRPDRMAVLEKLTVPLLIFHTTEDGFVPLERVRGLARHLPTALHVHIETPGVGHCSPLEAPKAVAWALNELLKHASPRAGAEAIERF
jgi:pimeloyl-ACP methyl ester carboxylesterase